MLVGLVFIKKAEKHEQINGVCEAACNPYKVLICNENYVGCSGLNGGTLTELKGQKHD